MNNDNKHGWDNAVPECKGECAAWLGAETHQEAYDAALLNDQLHAMVERHGAAWMLTTVADYLTSAEPAGNYERAEDAVRTAAGAMQSDPGENAQIAARRRTREQAAKLWATYRNGGRPTAEEREVLWRAYCDGTLCNDPDYNVAQWVEDGYPELP